MEETRTRRDAHLQVGVGALAEEVPGTESRGEGAV
jgi:hypothetical protein